MVLKDIRITCLKIYAQMKAAKGSGKKRSMQSEEEVGYIMRVEAGQLVIYDPGYKCEVGKVKRINPYFENKAFVWYHTGDTAACTDMNDLYPIDVRFAREHADLFENRYALEHLINKKVEENENGK